MKRQPTHTPEERRVLKKLKRGQREMELVGENCRGPRYDERRPRTRDIHRPPHLDALHPVERAHVFERILKRMRGSRASGRHRQIEEIVRVSYPHGTDWHTDLHIDVGPDSARIKTRGCNGEFSRDEVVAKQANLLKRYGIKALTVLIFAPLITGTLQEWEELPEWNTADGYSQELGGVAFATYEGGKTIAQSAWRYAIAPGLNKIAVSAENAYERHS